MSVLYLFLSLNENQAKVNGFGSEQSVAFRRHSQRQRIVLRLQSLQAELKLIDRRRKGSISEGTRQGDEGHMQRGGWLAFHHQLVADAAIHHVNRVVLAVVHTSLHRPLVRVRREPRRLVVQLWNEVVGAVRTQLDIWHWVVHSSAQQHTDNYWQKLYWLATLIGTNHTQALELTNCSTHQKLQRLYREYF